MLAIVALRASIDIWGILEMGDMVPMVCDCVVCGIVPFLPFLIFVLCMLLFV